jgi:cytochrome c
MDRWERTKVGASVILAVGVIFTGSWISDAVYDADYPDRQGYPVEGVAPVDLAAA